MSVLVSVSVGSVRSECVSTWMSMSASMSVRVSKPEVVSSVAAAVASTIAHPLIGFLISIDPTILMFSGAFQAKLLAVELKM